MMMMMYILTARCVFLQQYRTHMDIGNSNNYLGIQLIIACGDLTNTIAEGFFSLLGGPGDIVMLFEIGIALSNVQGTQQSCLFSIM